MGNLAEEVKKSGYTIIGRLGCCFYEGAINACKNAILQGKLIQYRLFSFHELPFENEIAKLQGSLPS